MVDRTKKHEERIEIRAIAEDAERWRETADAEGMTLSDWLRKLANDHSVDAEMIALVKTMKAARAKALKRSK